MAPLAMSGAFCGTRSPNRVLYHPELVKSEPALPKPKISKLSATLSMEEMVKLPRIWWIGVGEMSNVPFHAAGLYPSNQRHRARYTVQYCISSYIYIHKYQYNSPEALFLLMNILMRSHKGRLPCSIYPIFEVLHPVWQRQHHRIDKPVGRAPDRRKIPRACPIVQMGADLQRLTQDNVESKLST